MLALIILLLSVDTLGTLWMNYLAIEIRFDNNNKEGNRIIPIIGWECVRNLYKKKKILIKNQLAPQQ